MSRNIETYKILLVGDSGVGKTNILNRFDNKVLTPSITTIGIDFITKFITLENGNIVKLMVWDTAGMEKFRSITKTYYKGIDGALMICDMTYPRSFSNLELWYKDISDLCDNKDVVLHIVGNKYDLIEKEMCDIYIDENDIQDYAQKKNIDFTISSAKSNLRIQECFKKIAYQIYNVKKDKISEENDCLINRVKKTCEIDLDNNSNVSYCCCNFLN